MTVKYKTRCKDCSALAEGEHDEWICDLEDRPCNSILICEAWGSNKRYATISDYVPLKSVTNDILYEAERRKINCGDALEQLRNELINL